MRRLFAALAVAGCWFASADVADAQYPEPYYTYYPQAEVVAPPTMVYRPVEPVTTYYAPAPVTTYYAPSPTVVYRPVAPVTTYYAPAPVTTYYAPAPTVAYYAPTVAPVTAYYAPVGPAYYGRTKTYVYGQPVRNVLRAITPGVPTYAY